MSIQFIEKPPFSIDFKNFNRDPSPPAGSSVSFIARLVRVVVSPLFITIKNAPVSFKIQVMSWEKGGWAIPETLTLAVLKVAYWFFGMGASFVFTTARLAYQEFYIDKKSDQDFLKAFISPEIDPSHIVTNDLVIDVSHVPETVQVKDLKDLFSQINFTDPNQPGYMAPKSRQEGEKIYTVEDLNKGLDTFIAYVNGRVAFIGTPPQLDTARLLDFYREIENAVRFCIHKSNEDLNGFLKDHGSKVSEYSESLRKAYNNLLEDRARISLNLAIAGFHCGARYMGESLELYQSMNSESVIRGSLKDSLVEILAEKRREIATRQIYRKRGNDVHAYTQYMQSLGRTLAIPGSANIIEHLSSQLDRPACLKDFFAEYTVNCILETIKSKIDTSQLFREQISDWLQANRGSWRVSNEQEFEKIFVEASSLLNSSESEEEALKDPRLVNLAGCVEAFNQASSEEDGRGILKEERNLVESVLEAGASFFLHAYPSTDNGEYSRRVLAKQAIRNLLTNEQLGAGLVEKVTEATRAKEPLKLGDWVPGFILFKKIAALCTQTGLSKEVATQVVEGKISLKEALRDLENREQPVEFLTALESSQKNFSSPALLEWILVSQGILITQAKKEAQ